MEALIADGFVTGVADVTTTEWCDELVGGVLSAGPDRLDAAGGARACRRSSRSARSTWSTSGRRTRCRSSSESRNIYVHNPPGHADADDARGVRRSSARSSPRKLNKATGPTALFVPLKGVRMIDAEGMPFHDPVADAALFDADPRRTSTARRWS